MTTMNNGDTTRYWTAMLAEPGALIIDGGLYFVGPEPTVAELAANPKAYGSYGTGFTIGLADGTQLVTHNLGCCGEIPAHLRPADNAAFIGDPVHTPIRESALHDPFDYLDYIGGSYPYECVVCYRRFPAREVPEHVVQALFDSICGGDQ